MKNRTTSYLSIALSIFLIAGCSSGNPTTPNKANLSNLAKIPATTTDNENIKKINLSGRVLDSITRKPIEHATVLVYVIANDEVIKSIKSGTVPGASVSPAAPVVLPSPGVSANPGPDSSPNIVPDTVTTPASPAASVSASPAAPAPMVEENEEKTVKETLLPKPIHTLPSINPPKNITGQPVPKTVIKTTPQPTPVKPADTTKKTGKDKVKELTESDIISALTSLKINDIQEFDSSTGNDGKYWINKVPDSNIIMTVNAPNYKTVSIFNSDTSKVEDILLTPIESKQHITSVIGTVLSATNNPVDNASVSASYIVNDSFSIPSSTNNIGAFQLDDVSIGERTFIASVKDEAGKIIAMGSTDFDVKKGKVPARKIVVPLKKSEDKIKVKETPKTEKIIPGKADIKPTGENEEEIKRTEAPVTESTAASAIAATASPDKTAPEKKVEKIEEETVPVKEPVKTDNKKPVISKDYPVIKLKSVTDYIDLKGKITLPEETTLKSVNVYTTFKKKGQAKEEVFLTDKQLDSAAESFELSLPKPESGYYYHLEFVAVNKKGSYIYHHEYNQKKDNKEIKISFMQPLMLGKTDFIEKDGEKLPIFSWTPVEGASFYKVTLDKIDKDNNLTSVWEGLTPYNTAIYPISTGSARLNYSNTYNWSVVAVKESSTAGASDKLQFSKLNITSWSDLSHSPHMAFSPNIETGSEQIEEIDKDKNKEK